MPLKTAYLNLSCLRDHINEQNHKQGITGTKEIQYIDKNQQQTPNRAGDDNIPFVNFLNKHNKYSFLC